MSFFKRVLGIEELDNRMKKEISGIKDNLKTSWNWINYLHELEQDSRNKIKQLEKQNEELKELMKNKPASRIKPQEIESSQKAQNKPKKVPELKQENKAQKESNIAFKNIDISGIGKKEAFILQILYQLACFDGSSSISTTKIFDNLPYSITKRGLRKKLYKLQQQGAIGSVMYGNKRKWFLDMNKLTKLKKFLAARKA